MGGVTHVSDGAVSVGACAELPGLSVLPWRDAVNRCCFPEEGRVSETVTSRLGEFRRSFGGPILVTSTVAQAAGSGFSILIHAHTHARICCCLDVYLVRLFSAFVFVV